MWSNDLTDLAAINTLTFVPFICAYMNMKILFWYFCSMLGNVPIDIDH